MKSKCKNKKVVTKLECVIDYWDIEINQEYLDDLILEYLSDQMLPFLTCEKHSFRRVVEAGRGKWRVKTRKTYAIMLKFKNLNAK